MKLSIFIKNFALGILLTILSTFMISVVETSNNSSFWCITIITVIISLYVGTKTSIELKREDEKKCKCKSKTKQQLND